MALSNTVISQFAKITTNNKKTKDDTNVYGRIVVHNGEKFVQIDGSNLLTPFSTTADVKNEDRVIVNIKNHTATVIGNTTSRSASAADVEDVTGRVNDVENDMSHVVTDDEYAEFEKIFGDIYATFVKCGILEADTGSFNNLRADYANITHITSQDVNALNATIENLKVEVGTFDKLSADDITAINANLDNLKAKNGEFTYVSADQLKAVKAEVQELNADKISAESAELKYVNIDFSNITKAQMDEFYAKSGLINNVTMENGTVTSYLVGVTIKGDLIEGNTIKADKLVVLGDDGLYYKLNFDSGNFSGSEQVPTDSLHGSIITSNSITAEKISVSDLVAFDATIGGFEISNASIHSFSKETVDNTTQGVYMDNDGQFVVGDSENYLRYYKTTDGTYKLEISADSILFGANTKASVGDLTALAEHVKIGTYQGEPSIELAEGDSDFKQILTNTKAVFMDGSEVTTRLDTEGITTNNARINEELRLGGFIWTSRANGNCGMMWKGESN